MRRLSTVRLGNCVSTLGRSKKCSLMLIARTISWAQKSHLLGNDGSFCEGNPGEASSLLLLPSAKIKNAWSYTFIPPYFSTACTRTTSSITKKLNWWSFSLRCPMKVILSWRILHLLFRTLNIKIFSIWRRQKRTNLKNKPAIKQNDVTDRNRGEVELMEGKLQWLWLRAKYKFQFKDFSPDAHIRWTTGMTHCLVNVK
jgi:hypothetical protein